MSKELILNNPNYVTANLARKTHLNPDQVMYKTDIAALRSAIQNVAKKRKSTFSAICGRNGIPTSILAKSLDRWIYYGEHVGYTQITKKMRREGTYGFLTKHELEQLQEAFGLSDIRMYLIVTTPKPKPVPESHKRQMAENKIGPAIAAINSKAAKVSDLTPGELYTLISLAVAAGRNVDLTPPEV